MRMGGREGGYGGLGFGGWPWILGQLPMSRLGYWSPPASGALTLSRFLRLMFSNELRADCGFRTGGRDVGMYMRPDCASLTLYGGRDDAIYPSLLPRVGDYPLLHPPDKPRSLFYYSPPVGAQGSFFCCSAMCTP